MKPFLFPGEWRSCVRPKPYLNAAHTRRLGDGGVPQGPLTYRLPVLHTARLDLLFQLRSGRSNCVFTGTIIKMLKEASRFTDDLIALNTNECLYLSRQIHRRPGWAGTFRVQKTAFSLFSGPAVVFGGWGRRRQSISSKVCGSISLFTDPPPIISRPLSRWPRTGIQTVCPHWKKKKRRRRDGWRLLSLVKSVLF